MKTNTKIALKVTAVLMVAITIILTFTIFYLIAQKNEDVGKYRLEETHRTEDTLKERVDIAYATLEANYQDSTDKSFLEKYYGSRLRNIIDIAETILNSKLEALNKEELTLAEAQAQAKAEIAMLRYNNGNGYVWINDTILPYPKMIMHPINPSLDGQLLAGKEYNRAMGKGLNIYVEAVNLCLAHGKGFVDFLWDKPSKNGVIENVPKLAYVKLFHDWQWIIGTAAYVDEAQIDAKEKSQDDIRQINKHNNADKYLWISTAGPNPKMIVHPKKPLLEGKILEGGLKNLYKSFFDICRTHNGSGFKSYQWPDPPPGTNTFGSDKEVPKLSYFKLYPKLNWILGTDAEMDNIDKAVAEREMLIEKQIQYLILKIVILSIVIVLLIGILSYIMSPYFPKEKRQLASGAPSPYLGITPQPAPVSMSNSTPSPYLGVTPQPAPISMPSSTNVAQEIGNHSSPMLRTEDCVKMIQEISKTLIAEQAKILAAAMHQNPTHQNHHPEKASKEQQITDEINKLANNTSKTVDEVKKMVEANQPSQPKTLNTIAIDEVKNMLEANQPPQPKTLNTVEMGKFNNVMGNLNEMVNNVAKGLKT